MRYTVKATVGAPNGWLRCNTILPRDKTIGEIAFLDYQQFGQGICGVAAGSAWPPWAFLETVSIGEARNRRLTIVDTFPAPDTQVLYVTQDIDGAVNWLLHARARAADSQWRKSVTERITNAIGDTMSKQDKQDKTPPVTILETEFDPEQEVYRVALETGKDGVTAAHITGPERVFHVAVCQMLMPGKEASAQPLVVYRQECWMHGEKGGKALADFLKKYPDPEKLPEDAVIPEPDIAWRTDEFARVRLAPSREAAQSLAAAMLAEAAGLGTGEERGE